MLDMEDRRRKENMERDIEQKREDREFQFKVHDDCIAIFKSKIISNSLGSTADVRQ